MDSQEPSLPRPGCEAPAEKAPRQPHRDDIAVAADLVRLAQDYSHPPPPRLVLLPLTLFLATCASTFWTGTCMGALWDGHHGANPISFMSSFKLAGWVIGEYWRSGATYMAAVMAILLTHEMGHFVTTLRYRIPANFPFFIPMPLFLFGTMGAVIGMEGSRANRRQMFDQGLAGPLAGLIVALPVTWIGIAQLGNAPPADHGLCFHNPLIFQWIIGFVSPDFPDPSVLALNQFNPFLLAGYVGMLVTGLNMLPIGQLDGGHVTYALMGRRAHVLARALLIGTILAVVIWEIYVWVLMVVIVTLIGTDHPPTADDHARLGWFRRTNGWASLAIPIVCFHPLVISEIGR